MGWHNDRSVGLADLQARCCCRAVPIEAWNGTKGAHAGGEIVSRSEKAMVRKVFAPILARNRASEQA